MIHASCFMRMKWVYLIEFDAIKREGRVAATCVLGDDHVVRCAGDEPLVAMLTAGIRGPENKPLTPADGLAFLEALPKEFRSAYLFATDVEEGAELLLYRTPTAKKVP